MDDILARVALLAALILFSAFFSGSETALFSISRVQLLRLREEKHARAGLLESLLSRPRRLIATIFIGNEMVNIGVSALAASMVEDLAHGTAWAGELALTLLSTGLSVPLILLFGEITPKNLAVQIGEPWALAAARPLGLMAAAFAPLRVAIEAISDLTVRALGGAAAPPPQRPVTEEEFRVLVARAGEDGEIGEQERSLITRTLDLGDRPVSQVMTPAERVFALSVDLPADRALAEVRANVYSRVPVYRDTPDRVAGVLLAKDLLAAVRPGREPPPLGDLVKPPFVVRPDTRCGRLVGEFQKRKLHLAIVADEHRRMLGVVTLEDLLEEVFGEIVDEKEARRRPEPGPREGGAPAPGARP